MGMEMTEGQRMRKFRLSQRSWIPLLLVSVGCDVQPDALKVSEATQEVRTVPLDELPFEIDDVIDRVSRSYREESGAFVGGHDTYLVRAERGRFSVTPRAFVDDGLVEVDAASARPKFVVGA